MESPHKRTLLILTDGLGSGGIEEWIVDIVNFKGIEEYDYHVICVDALQPDQFVHEPRLKELGAEITHLAAPRIWSNFWTKLIGLFRRNISNFSASKSKPSTQNPSKTGAININKPGIYGLYQIFLRLPALIHLLWFGFKLANNNKYGEKLMAIHGNGFYGFLATALLSLMIGQSGRKRVRIVYFVPALKSHIDMYFPFIYPLYSKFQNMFHHYLTAVDPQELLSSGVDKERIMRLPMGAVDPNRVDLIDDNDNDFFKKLNSRHLLVSIGRLVIEKGHDDAIELVAGLKDDFYDIRLLILGEGPKRQELEELVKTKRLEENVIFCGFQRDLGPYLSPRSILLKLMKKEGLNRAIMNAMAYGRPVVGFRTDNWSEQLDHEKHALLCKPGDIATLIDHTRRLFNDPEDYSRLSQVSRDLATDKYHYSKTIGVFFQSYGAERT